MTTTQSTTTGEGVLNALVALVERHREGAAEALPELLDELAGVLRRGRAAVRRVQRANTSAAPAAAVPTPASAPTPAQKPAASAPVSSPAQKSASAAAPIVRPSSALPATERTPRAVLALAAAAITMLAVLVLALALVGPGGGGQAWATWLTGVGVRCLPSGLLVAMFR